MPFERCSPFIIIIPGRSGLRQERERESEVKWPIFHSGAAGYLIHMAGCIVVAATAHLPLLEPVVGMNEARLS